MRKINDRVLLEMADRGDQGKDIAAHFGVTPAAICIRLQQLRKHQKHAAALSGLTGQQQRFVIAVVEGKSKTDAAMESFDVTSRDSAKTIGHRLGKDAEIQLAISTLMENEGLSRQHLIKRLKNHVDGDDPAVSLRAVDTGLKLFNSFPATRNINQHIHAEHTVGGIIEQIMDGASSLVIEADIVE